MTCDETLKYPCPRCGVDQGLFSSSYPRHWWKDNRKQQGYVCWKCAEELDWIALNRAENVLRRKR